MAFASRTLSPTVWITVERVTQQGLWLVLFAVLAPILGPRPYGLFSIVMVFVGISEFILIEGTVEALLTVDELDYLHTTTANVASCTIALGFAILMAIMAPVIAIIFHDAEIRSLIWTLAPLPVLSSLSSTPIAVLQRALQYKQLAIRSIAGLTIGGICGIILAVEGAGVWALVLQILSQRLAELAIAWIFVPTRLGFRWSSIHFRALSPVGKNVFAARAMIFASGQVPRLIIGYFLGATALGLFTLANRFLDVIVHTAVSPRTAVGRIELREAPIGSVEFERLYSKMVQNVSLLSFPIFFGAATIAPNLFSVWLDHRWLPGVVPTQLVILGGVPLALFYCFDAALLAANRSAVLRRLANLQTLTVTATVLCTATFGLNVVCLSLAARQWLLLPISLILFSRAILMPIYNALRSALLSISGAISMAVILMLFMLQTSFSNEYYNVCTIIVFGVAFYSIYFLCFGRDQLKSFINDVVFSRN
jgi:O-antigen/teichoic acid export membrane protein